MPGRLTGKYRRSCVHNRKREKPVNKRAMPAESIDSLDGDWTEAMEGLLLT